MGDDGFSIKGDLQASHPDCYGVPSKKLAEIRESNSKQGPRRCKNPKCNKTLATSNTSNFCYACHKKLRLKTISAVTTRSAEADPELDFDS